MGDFNIHLKHEKWGALTEAMGKRGLMRDFNNFETHKRGKTIDRIFFDSPIFKQYKFNHMCEEYSDHKITSF